MASLLFHDSIQDEILMTDLSDGAYRALFASMFYVIRHHTNWTVPYYNIDRVAPTKEVYDELVRTGWWLLHEGQVHVATHGPRDWRTQVLMRRCPNDRAPISADLRERIYSRDGHQCVTCAATEDLSLDHIWPWSKGGTDDEDNLRTLCRSCNSRKGAKV